MNARDLNARAERRRVDTRPPIAVAFERRRRRLANVAIVVFLVVAVAVFVFAGVL